MCGVGVGRWLFGFITRHSLFPYGRDRSRSSSRQSDPSNVRVNNAYSAAPTEYSQPHWTAKLEFDANLPAPTDLASVERMILHYKGTMRICSPLPTLCR